MARIAGRTLCGALLAVLPLLLGACSVVPHLSFLDPHGPVASIQRKHFLEMVALLSVFVAGPIFLLIPFFAWRYRYGATSSRYTPRWNYFLPLEIAAWGGPLVIVGVLAVLVWTSTHDLDPYKPMASPAQPLRVQVIGYDWKWLFIYPDQGIASVGILAIPAGRPLALELTSATVMQSLHIPSLGSQIYAMGGMVTQLHLQADAPGAFMGDNTMYNGRGFHQQRFTAVAMSTADFNAWVAKARNGGTPMTRQALKMLSRQGTRADLIAAFPAGSSMDGNLYFNGVTPSLFPTLVQAVKAGTPLASDHALDAAEAKAKPPTTKGEHLAAPQP